MPNAGLATSAVLVRRARLVRYLILHRVLQTGTCVGIAGLARLADSGVDVAADAGVAPAWWRSLRLLRSS